MSSATESVVEPMAQIGRWVIGKIHRQKVEKPVVPGKQIPTVSNVFMDITFLLDRSGSMGSLRETAVRAINDFMRKVDEEPGDGCWSLVQFDDHSSAAGAKEAFPHKTFSCVPSEARPFLELQAYQPRGGTALCDALASVVLETKVRVEQQVPTEIRKDYKVLIVVMTDGQENSSQHWNKAKLRELIAERQAAGWVFTYLGANQDAFAEADAVGIRQTSATPTAFFGGIQADWGGNAKGLVGATCRSADNARGWRADGNKTADALQGSGQPDPKVQSAENG